MPTAASVQPASIRGFSWIELPIVISISAVLAALSLPAIQMVSAAADTAVCASHLRRTTPGARLSPPVMATWRESAYTATHAAGKPLLKQLWQDDKLPAAARGRERSAGPDCKTS